MALLSKLMLNMLLLFSLDGVWFWLVSKTCYMYLSLDITLICGCMNCLLCNGWMLDYLVFFADDVSPALCMYDMARHSLCLLYSLYSSEDIATWSMSRFISQSGLWASPSVISLSTHLVF
jgi:hypothetical protein